MFHINKGDVGTLSQEVFLTERFRVLNDLNRNKRFPSQSITVAVYDVYVSVKVVDGVKVCSDLVTVYLVGNRDIWYRIDPEELGVTKFK